MPQLSPTTIGIEIQTTAHDQSDADTESIGLSQVKIVDECPCYKPDNQRSNAEWCCGDMPHLDMSEWALEKVLSWNSVSFKSQLVLAAVGLSMISRCRGLLRRRLW